MSLLVTVEFGTKENPHQITPPKKDRIKNNYYIFKNEVRYWDGHNLINKEKEREQKKKYKQSEKGKKSDKKYNQSEKGKKRNKKYNQSRNKRYSDDPIFRLLSCLRSTLNSSLNTQCASKNQRTLEYVSCSVAQLRNHLESQFGDSGMNWDNSGKNKYGMWYYGRGWEIDHRKPCDSFDINDEEQKYMCFHWTNLQPMWGEENNKKSNKFNPETFQYKWMGRETGWVGIPNYLMNN